MLGRIPSDYLRQKILEKNVWYVGDSMFHASQWNSSSDNSSPREAIQIWAHLTGVPLDLRYQAGLSLVAGLIGEPKETDEFTLNLVSLELPHVKVEVKLSEPLPRVIEFVRQSGEVVEVQVDYHWVPPTCAHCNELRHISRNCLLLPAPPLGAAFPSSKVLKKTTPKAVSKDKVYVSIAIPPVVHAGTLPSAPLPSPSSSAPSLPCPPPPPVAPVTTAPPLHHLDPSLSKNPSPLLSSPLIYDSSPPLTFISPNGFLFPISPPATTKKQSLQRSKSIPSFHSFPSFMSQLAYCSSLPPLTSNTSNTLPTKENCPIKNTSLDPPSIPTSNPFDHLATESALYSEEPQNL
ncbi:hypothetical protein F2Q69_00060202 [Brassica cretica]|uniref:DUF4283 domain-containing protein n=1 Tax=Brassica cretica TaxID=69181 RepID=A0A8S9RQ94_BRACR|nr:hypothetical protein F2Q69_00060202 [Brassica cretica]